MQEGIHKDKPSVKQNIWKLLALKYDYVEGAQISNSFLCLFALDNTVSTTEISKLYLQRQRDGFLRYLLRSRIH